MAKELLLKVLTSSSDDHIMVNKAILVGFLESLPEDILAGFSKKMLIKAPEIGSTEFRTWVINSRILLGLNQSQLGALAKIGQEEICKYEKGTLNFGSSRQLKLRNFFIHKFSEQDKETA